MKKLDGAIPVDGGPLNGGTIRISEYGHIAVLTIEFPESSMTYGLVEEFEGTTRKLFWKHQPVLIDDEPEIR